LFRIGNLHLNVCAASYSPEIEAALEPFVYELTGAYLSLLHLFFFSLMQIEPASYNGSISAEHGLGAMKAHAIYYSKSGVAVNLMKKLKDVFDPRGIMNPGKVLE
jgi:(R)-2-hydroxyglutarate---pyruvate transhydrogenase